VLVARSAKGVCSILLGDNSDELAADLANRFPCSVLVRSEAAVKADLATVLRYIKKPADGLHLALHMRGTPFQRRVWEKLKAISAGRTVSYMELANGSARWPTRVPSLAPARRTRSRWQSHVTVLLLRGHLMHEIVRDPARLEAAKTFILDRLKVARSDRSSPRFFRSMRSSTRIAFSSRTSNSARSW
jgi:6-O-methylguanine DNA methyltransferase, DNA binding domain